MRVELQELAREDVRHVRLVEARGDEKGAPLLLRDVQVGDRAVGDALVFELERLSALVLGGVGLRGSDTESSA